MVRVWAFGRAIGMAYFSAHYHHRVYENLYAGLSVLAESLLTGKPVDHVANQRFLGPLRATSYDENYYREHKLAGLDYLVFGRWHEQYGRWLVESLGLKDKRVLDVGCACGAVLRGLGQAGALGQGIDLSECMIRLGREQWPELASRLAVVDAVNLHLFRDGEFDAIHTAQVAEHWQPDLVPHILRELRRVTAPGGLLFCSLDTEDLFRRQGRDSTREDPTHLCIRPFAWWRWQLAQAGWQICSAEFEQRLRDHPESMLKLYDWDWFVARRP